MATERTLVIKTRVTLDAGTGNHRLQFWVHEAINIEPYCFVYQRFPPPPGSATPDDRFTNIASSSDMAEYQHTSPAAGEVFFRLSSGDLLYRSVDLLNNFVLTLQEDVQDLLRNLHRLDEIGTENTYNYTI